MSWAVIDTSRPTSAAVTGTHAAALVERAYAAAAFDAAAFGTPTEAAAAGKAARAVVGAGAAGLQLGLFTTAAAAKAAAIEFVTKSTANTHAPSPPPLTQEWDENGEGAGFHPAAPLSENAALVSLTPPPPPPTHGSHAGAVYSEMGRVDVGGEVCSLTVRVIRTQGD
jgi:hypothetical protein